MTGLFHQLTDEDMVGVLQRCQYFDLEKVRCFLEGIDNKYADKYIEHIDNLNSELEHIKNTLIKRADDYDDNTDNRDIL